LKLLAEIFLVFFIVFFLISCSRKDEPKIIEAKVIEYKIEYIDEVAGTVPTKILPGKMTLIFTDRMAMNYIEGFLGQFTLTYIADLKKETVITMLKLFDKNYFYQGSAGEQPAGIAPMNGLVLEKTDSIDQILDFNATKYILHVPGDKDREIWCTPDIKIKDLNITTPYKSLEEVLLQFYTELSVLKMVMKANKYEEKTLNSEIFKVPDKYLEISRLKMEKILNELFR